MDRTIEVPMDGSTSAREWKAQSRCNGLDTNWFFGPGQIEARDSVCAYCPVTQECLTYTLEFEKRIGWRSGVSGNTTPEDRNRLFGRLRDSHHTNIVRD